MSARAGIDPTGEGRHEPAADATWHEGWTFDVRTPDGTIGGWTGLVLWPGRRRAWYWAALVRAGHPLLHVADLDVPLPRRGLEVRAEGLWADHVCEEPYEQWTVANEAYAVALDDPAEALGRAHGDLTAMAFDIEWYASDPGAALDDVAGGTVTGYGQDGEAHAVIELAGGPLTVVGPAQRRHWWGTTYPWSGFDARAPRPAGLLVAVRLASPAGAPLALERVLTATGWWEAQRPL